MTELPPESGPETPPPTPYPPPPYPAPPYAPYVVAPPMNTYAILSAIFAFAVFAPVGIYLGYKARRQIEQTGERGIELAKVGIIGGWILTGLQALFLLVWCGGFIAFMSFSRANGQ